MEPCTLEEVKQAMQHTEKTPAAQAFHAFLALEAIGSFPRTWLAREILKMMEEAEELAEVEEEEIQREIAAECAGIEARVRARHAEAKEERRRQAEAKEQRGP